MKKAIYKTGLSSQELLSLIDENFYEIVPTKRKLMQFTRIFIDTFCEENGIVPADLVTFANVSGKTGTYLNDRFLIKINSGFTKSYKDAVESKNYYFLYAYFKSIFHDLRLHCQSVDSQLVPQIIGNVARIQRQLKAFKAFNKEVNNKPLELDAQHASFRMLKSVKLFVPYTKLPYEKLNKFYYKAASNVKLVGILKDKDFRNIKYITAPRRALESLVKNIAIKNGLSFVVPKGKFNSEIDEENDRALNKKIAQEIAPDFFEMAGAKEDEDLSRKELKFYGGQEDEFKHNYKANLRKSRKSKDDENYL